MSPLEHYSNFYTFEIASLLNVPGYYLRKYGSLFVLWLVIVLETSSIIILQISKLTVPYFCNWDISIDNHHLDCSISKFDGWSAAKIQNLKGANSAPTPSAPGFRVMFDSTPDLFEDSAKSYRNATGSLPFLLSWRERVFEVENSVLQTV